MKGHQLPGTLRTPIATEGACMGRAHFLDQLDRLLSRALQQQVEAPVALILAEADAFELLAGWYGYREVSAQLQQAALRVDARLQNLATSLDSEALFERVGDAGFAFALFGALARDAAGVAQLLRDDLRGPWRLGGEMREVPFSIGVTAQHAVADADTLYCLARGALEQAARQGNTFEAAGGNELLRHERSRTIGTSLKRALERRELLLEYQPLVDLEDMRVVGLEALLRWNHPVLGRVSPVDFVPVAARAGCLGELGDWVLHNACQDFSRLRRDGALRDLRFLSVNVSRQNISDPALPDKVISALRRARMTPAQLLLEITESELLTDAARTARTLRLVRSLGARVAIDDFGVGHSSLASLHELPVDMLKLDRSFLGNGLGGRRSRDLFAIAHAIVNMARSVNLDVVVEGVESPGQLLLLRSLQCQLAQGFALCRPMPADALAGACAGLSSSLAGQGRMMPGGG